MGLAVKSPPCCCSSLRAASLVLLYFNLVINGYALLSRLFKQSNESYMQALDVDGIMVIEVLMEVASFIIFLITIITIYKENPSVHMLTAAVGILFVSVVYTIYMMIALNAGYEELFKIFVDEQMADSNSQGEELERERNTILSFEKPLLFFLNVFLLGSCVWYLYSALIFHSYKEDLKQRPVYGVPPQQYNPQDREANVTAPAPYPPNAQFVTVPYPTQPSQYDLPPKYPIQPPPQNYTQAPPY